MWSQGAVGLDAVVPVYDVDHKVLGVLDTSLALAGTGAFLQQLAVSPHGQTFIIERSGLLVASSTIKEPYTRGSGDLNRLSALDSTDPLIRSATECLVQVYGALSNI